MNEQGIYSEIPEEAYHLDPCDKPSLNSTIGKLLIDKTPYHAWLNHPRLNPNYQPDNDKKFDLGTASHAVILEKKPVFTIQYDNYRTNDAKEKRNVAIESGQIPLLQKDYEDVCLMRDVFNKFILQSEIDYHWRSGKPEQTIIWHENGYPMRGRIDFLPDNHEIIIDYKTTKDANPIDFINKKIVQMGYDFQAAFYLRGLETITGKFAHFVWIIQETEPPYSCSLVGLGEEFRELGMKKVITAIDTWISCLNSNKFNNYPNRIIWASPKPWAAFDFDDKELIVNGGE